MQYTFGDCRFNVASRELTRKGQAVHLSPKAFDLLRLLIEKRPAVLSKQDLMSSLWPDTFVVEANLPVLVGELRAAIGDRAAATSASKTHHGIGYSFAADVVESSAPKLGATHVPEVLLKVGTRRIALGPGLNGVGRDPACDVFLNDASVSRSHAHITVSAETATVVDVGSKNGTFVRGTRIAEATPLVDGDALRFGSIEAEFIVVSYRDSQSTVTLDRPNR